MIRYFLILMLVALPAHADNFAFTDLQGHALKLSQFKGKWVLINFWGRNCAPCQAETPELVSLYRAHQGRNLAVIGIAMGEKSPSALAEYVRQQGIPYPVVLGNDIIAAQVGDFESLPATFLYDPSGDLAAAHPGAITRDIIERLIR